MYVFKALIISKINSFILSDLLSDTVHSAPQLLLESSGKVQEICLKLAELPPKTTGGLLTSIQPLLKLSPLLKDTIILALRKAMFAR